MIYNSIEIIPAKIYFKIEQTGSIELLTDEKKPDMAILSEVWKHLKKQNNALPESLEGKMVHSVNVRLGILNSRIEAVSMAVHVLKHMFNQQMMDILIEKEYFTKDYDHTDNEKFQMDLIKVNRETEALQMKVDLLNDKLPKEDKNKKKVTFDQSVMGWAAFTGSGFIDPNLITLSQYYAIMNLGEDKIKSLERVSGKNK